MLLLSGGDNFTGRDDREWKRQSRFLWEMMGEIGWDLSAVQSTDLLLGAQALKDAAAEQGIPLICANLFDSENHPVFEGSRIFDVGGKRVAVLAVVEAEEQSALNRMDNELHFGDARAAVVEGVRELQPRSDAIILLYGGRRGTVLERCKSIEGLDLIFYGMASSSQRVPAETELGTPVYSAASRGKDFGEITLTLLDGGGVKCSPFTVHELDRNVEEDPTIREKVAEFKAEAALRKSHTREIRNAVAEVSEITVPENYVGIERCTSCHQDIVESFYETAHARSFDTLVDAFEENNPACVACHVTGWKVPGGFGQASSDKRNLEQVQCEACHGKGTAHVRDGGMLVEARKACTRCHNGEMPEACGSPPDFDYTDLWEKIAH